LPQVDRACAWRIWRRQNRLVRLKRDDAGPPRRGSQTNPCPSRFCSEALFSEPRFCSETFFVPKLWPRGRGTFAAGSSWLPCWPLICSTPVSFLYSRDVRSSHIYFLSPCFDNDRYSRFLTSFAASTAFWTRFAFSVSGPGRRCGFDASAVVLPQGNLRSGDGQLRYRTPIN